MVGRGGLCRCSFRADETNWGPHCFILPMETAHLAAAAPASMVDCNLWHDAMGSASPGTRHPRPSASQGTASAQAVGLTAVRDDFRTATAACAANGRRGPVRELPRRVERAETAPDAGGRSSSSASFEAEAVVLTVGAACCVRRQGSRMTARDLAECSRFGHQAAAAGLGLGSGYKGCLCPGRCRCPRERRLPCLLCLLGRSPMAAWVIRSRCGCTKS